MTTARTNTGTSPLHAGPTTKAAPAIHFRTRCILCSGSGTVIEWRVKWQLQALDQPPKRRCSAAFETEAEASDEFRRALARAEANPGSIGEVDIVSGARTCACRMVAGEHPAKPKLAARRTEGTPARQHGPTTTKRLVVVDRKSAAAGDRD
jgi:hypothetical protein